MVEICRSLVRLVESIARGISIERPTIIIKLYISMFLIYTIAWWHEIFHIHYAPIFSEVAEEIFPHWIAIQQVFVAWNQWT